MSNTLALKNQKQAKEKKKDIRKSVIIYHLHQIEQYIDKIQQSMFILRNFSENEHETREAIALQSTDNTRPRISKTYDSDRRFMQFMEAFEDESQKIKKEMLQIRKNLKQYSKLLFLLKKAVIHLKEPEKSVITMRYFKKLSWKKIHEKNKKSESYTFYIHAQGIKELISFFTTEQMDFLHQAYLSDTKNTFFYPKKKQSIS